MIIKILRVLIISMVVAIAACSNHVAPVINAWTDNSISSSDYKVQPEDTIYSIAWGFGMDYKDIVRYNHLTEPYKLHAGQILKMAPTAEVQTAVVTVEEVRKPTAVIAQKPRPIKQAMVKNAVVAAAPTPTPAVVISKPTHKTWVWPASGKILRGFSMASGGNRGIDIGGKLNDPVIATAAGKVVYAGNSMPGYGNLIIIKHNDNDLSAYAFNKTMSVNEGQKVAAGQQIAKMGKNDKGQTLLHFEIRQNGKPVNPLNYLK